MITLYKYLFYSYSYVIRKYDNLWNVGDTYFVGGGMWMGWMITATILDISELIRFLFPALSPPPLFPYLIYAPLILGIGICIYLGYGRRCDKIYDEMANMDKTKKKVFKTLNILNLIIVHVGLLVLGEYARHLNGFSSFLFD